MKLLLNTMLAGALFATSASVTAPANAVASPGAINWTTSSPTAFVTSLYVGVLGRSPESSAVVATWAASVTSNPTSRLNVLAGFVNSPEYRAAYGSTAGTWQLGYRYVGNGRRWAAYRTNDGRWITSRSNLSNGYARALVGYYNTYATR